MDKPLRTQINQPLNHSFDSLHPSSLTRPSKSGPRPEPEPDPGACVAPSIPISYTTHLACVSIAKCNVGAVLLLPIPTSPMVHGTRALRVVAPRSRAPLLRRASLPRPLGLYTTQYCLPCIRAYIHAHIRYSRPGQGCCLAIIVMIVVVMATSTHTQPGLGFQHGLPAPGFLILSYTALFTCLLRNLRNRIE